MPPLVGELEWDAPLRLLGGLHALVLAGHAAWDDLDAALAHPELPGLARRSVQTNEVRRSWTLVPCFLELARRTGADALDLVELGSSAGFNLIWDRYRHRYAAGTWGPPDAVLQLEGDERGPVPAGLLAVAPRVGERVGIDLDPVDVTTGAGALRLRSFVWPGQPDRLERLDRAIDAVRRDPPELVRGDFAEQLEPLLGRRRLGSLTVVFMTAVLGYVSDAGWARTQEVLAEAGSRAPLAFVWADRPAPGVDEYWGLWLRLWPGGAPELLAHADVHGAWLEWLA